MLEKLDNCTICPHKCGINRNNGKVGRCKSKDTVKIALYSVHNFEEPCISGEKGSRNNIFLELQHELYILPKPRNKSAGQRQRNNSRRTS